jgi:hypothetical protein
MNYAILRTAKLKTMGNIGGSLAHSYRTRKTNWGRDIQAKSDQRVRQSQAPHLEIK